MPAEGIRERHGVTCIEPGIGSGHVAIAEVESGILVLRYTGDRFLSPAQARYIASRLYRLARRVEQREQTSS